MAHRGEAADYYDSAPAPPQQSYGGGNHHARGGGHRGQQQQYQQQDYSQQPQQQQWNGPSHMPPPPTYNDNFGTWDTKPTFQEAFKVEKPKWNDIWAGLLFLAVAAGFVAVSGIAIQGYASTYGFNGGGIYGSDNNFGLSTNTIVLFAFCLVIALVLGFAYVAVARMFTKQFIWITGILNILL
jgi:hypothetical protein